MNFEIPAALGLTAFVIPRYSECEYRTILNHLVDAGRSHASAIVYLELIHFTDEEGVSSPRLAELAERVRMPKDAVSNHLRRLEAAGFLDRQQRGQALSTLYRFHNHSYFHSVPELTWPKASFTRKTEKAISTRVFRKTEKAISSNDGGFRGWKTEKPISYKEVVVVLKSSVEEKSKAKANSTPPPGVESSTHAHAIRCWPGTDEELKPVEEFIGLFVDLDTEIARKVADKAQARSALPLTAADLTRALSLVVESVQGKVKGAGLFLQCIGKYVADPSFQAGIRKKQSQAEENKTQLEENATVRPQLEDAGTIWPAAKAKLEKHFAGTTTYANWFETTFQLSPDREQALQIAVPDPQTKCWLEQEFSEVMRKALPPGYSLTYVVIEPAAVFSVRDEAPSRYAVN